ncbi:MAG: methyl-accepting chemotaxis protein [Coleofasciculaceae cyanobacterium]
MTTRFNSNSTAYPQEENGKVPNSLNGLKQGELSAYSNHQNYQPLLTNQSMTNEVKPQQMNISSTTNKFQSSRGSRWQGLRLTQKATALAIALGTIPVLLVGGTAYKLADKAITKNISQNKVASTIDLQSKVEHFMRDRYADIQVLAELPMLSNPQQRETTTLEQKQAVLESYIKTYKFYNSIAVFDLNGDAIVKAGGEAIGNHADREYFKAVIETNQPYISRPINSQSTDIFSIYFSAPVKDQATGETVAVIRSRMPVKQLEELLQNYGDDGDEYFLIDTSEGKIFLAKESNKENQEPQAVFPGLEKLQATQAPGSLVTTDQIEKQKDLLAYAPFAELEGLPELPWAAAIATETEIAFGSQRQMLMALSLGVGLTVLLVSAVAIYLAKRATYPLLAASKAVQQMGQGDLSPRLDVQGEDELAILTSNINLMAERVQTLIAEQKASVEEAQLFSEIATYSATEEDRASVFNRAVEGAKVRLKADRVVVYSFDSDLSGTIIAEAVEPGWPLAFAEQISDPCIGSQLIEQFRKGRIVPTSDVYATQYSSAHLQLLKRLEVKANLVVPIISGEDLIGLLIAHQCSNTRVWQQSEIDFLNKLGTQVGLALTSVRFIDQKEAEVERAEQLNQLSTRIRSSLKVEDIYETTITGVREAIKTDRVIVYLFDEKWQGSVVAESVASGWPTSLGANIADPCFSEHYVDKYKAGLVSYNNDIYAAELDPCYMGQLEPFMVRANLVAPIIAYDKLHGLLVTHQCSGVRVWQESEINFFKQAAIQVGSALDLVYLLGQQQEARQLAEDASAEQRKQKEELQLQLLGLLGDVEGAARGDLTVRADVTAGEIGTVADFFNSIIENLREIVTRVKRSAIEVNAAIGEDEEAIRQLSEEALQQAEDTTRILNSVEEMTQSIQAVAQSARQAAEVAGTASDTAEKGQATMDLTVQNILSLRATVAETAKKVKRLGESSQQISKVVALINKIALQTNLLAINAGIEAARAGEEGQGFAVVAEEVGELAEKSAAATSEIEKIVENIQIETAQVLEAMEESTSQVVEGTRLVDNTKDSLGQILSVSHQINQLVQSISEATVSQTKTSEEVSGLMYQIAMASARSSSSSSKVSNSLIRTVEIAQELQASVGTFKIEKLA